MTRAYDPIHLQADPAPGTYTHLPRLADQPLDPPDRTGITLCEEAGNPTLTEPVWIAHNTTVLDSIACHPPPCPECLELAHS